MNTKEPRQARFPSNPGRLSGKWTWSCTPLSNGRGEPPFPALAGTRSAIGQVSGPGNAASLDGGRNRECQRTLAKFAQPAVVAPISQRLDDHLRDFHHSRPNAIFDESINGLQKLARFSTSHNFVRISQAAGRRRG